MTLGLLVALENTDKQTDIQDSCFISIDKVFFQTAEKHSSINIERCTSVYRNADVWHLQLFEMADLQITQWTAVQIDRHDIL